MKKIFLASFIFISLWACNRITNADYGVIGFSSDTVFFDTIFTQIGSTTKQFKLYNSTNKPILLDQIYLAGGDASKYRLNIDGYADNSVKDIIIDANDSLFIFVEVTIDPGVDNVIEADSIMFISGNNTQKVILYAVGKDVHLINGRYVGTQTWTADKAYLIYNSMAVDTSETLTIEPGVEIYSHRNSYIIVYGTLIANGTIDEPIILRGDRIDNDDYIDAPGQWGGIYFARGSVDNYLKYIKLTEGFFGVAVDSSVTDASPTLTIENSQIMHCSYTGLYAYKTNVNVYNSVIADCGVNNIGLFLNGTYNFYHCTIQNNYKYSTRSSSAVGIQNYYVDSENVAQYGGYINASFYNCIISGGLENEFIVNQYPAQNGMEFTVQNSIVKIGTDLNSSYSTNFVNVLVNQSPEYVDIEEYDYHLSEESPAINYGNINFVNQNLSILNFDLDGINRLSDNKPDIGAYEYVQ